MCNHNKMKAEVNLKILKCSIKLDTKGSLKSGRQYEQSFIFKKPIVSVIFLKKMYYVFE